MNQHKKSCGRVWVRQVTRAQLGLKISGYRVFPSVPMSDNLSRFGPDHPSREFMLRTP